MPSIADRPLTDAEFERISEMVYQHCGINLHDGKKQLVQARVAKRLRAGNFGSLNDYLDFVIEEPSGQEFTLLIDAMSTNLTSFYREPDHFKFMVDVALPELIQRKQKQGDRTIRLWSSACSTGEEPYTLAMILRDAIPDINRWDVKILASDISTHVLRVAKRGFYSADRLKPLPQGYATRFFRSANLDGTKGFEVSPELTQMIAFRHLNLMNNWPFTGPFDIIFCRNVMIYFDKPTQERLVNRFHNVLSKGGILFTGHSESLTGVNHPFGYVRPTVYAKN
jgi:chemotaxis protein methyltransferase CheR